MKQLIVHAGYPKTATATLQRNVLYKLHEEKKINFLGKAGYDGSEIFKTNSRILQNTLLGTHMISTKNCLPLNTKDKILAIEDDKNRFKEMIPGEFCSLLCDNLINVLSVEEMLAPYKTLAGFASIPRRLKLMFDDGKTEIKIMLVLRCQGSLIQSFYAQVYNRFCQYKELDTPSKTFFQNTDNLKSGEYSEVFDFHRIASLYSETFGRKNIEILFFEDFLADRLLFASKIANLLAIDDVALIEQLLNQKGFNIKDKQGTGYVVKLPQKTLFAKMLVKANRSGHLDIFKKMLKSNNPFRLFLKSIATHKVNVPEFSAEQKNSIFNFYRDSNLLLAHDFNIDIEKLKKYGYI